MLNTDQAMAESAQANAAISKKRYAAPKLESYGDIRDLTLGGSPGNEESGTPRTKKRRNSGNPLRAVDVDGAGRLSK